MQTVEEVLRVASQAHLDRNWPLAEHLYCKIISTAEDHPTAYFLLGTLYAQALASGRAITFLKKALEMEPDNFGAMHNLGSVYRHIENREQAVYWTEKSLALNRNPSILSNLSGCYINQGQPQKALEYADEALELKPDFPEAGNHRALALLEMGRFEEGWKQYDSRMECVGRQDESAATIARFSRRPYTVPMWKGEAVDVLAIHGEQGLGDEIMFLTCLKQIREQYKIGRIVIECAERLVKIFANSFPDIKFYGTHDELVGTEKPDAYIAMGSLPRFMWPVVPNVYLKPTTRYPRGDEFRIGLSWFGGTALTHMQLRNTLVDHWRVLPDDNAEFVSVQYGPREQEAMLLGIPHDAEAIADIDRLSSLIASCDLIVTVCNTTFHQAGAMGVPCLVLVPSKPDWRVLQTGDKTPWYESVTLLRQAEGEAWTSVLSRAKEWIATYRRVSGTEPRATRVAA